jgi:Fur family ferric uptake transcriptional regulator
MPPALHQEERRQFERLLRQQRMDRIGDRMAVLEVFLTSEEHQTAEGWHRLLQRQGLDFGAEFVAQTLELLVKFGLATRREFEGGPARYEHRHLGEHHDHLICTACNRISEFYDPELEELKTRAAAERGFHGLRHKLQIYGLCAECQAKRQPAMPLALAAPGERLRVEGVGGGGEAARQLTDLGLTVGAELEVISANGGPMVVAVGGTRVALGRGAAHKVQVSQITAKEG